MAIIRPGVWELEIFQMPKFTLDRPVPGFNFVEGRLFRPLTTIPGNTILTTEDFEFKTREILGFGGSGPIAKAVQDIDNKIRLQGSEVIAYTLWRRTDTNVKIPDEACVPEKAFGIPIPFVGGKCTPVPGIGGLTLAKAETWRLKVLHSAVGIGFFIGVSILVLTGLIALWGIRHLESIPEEFARWRESAGEFWEDFTEIPGEFVGGATSALLLFVIGGAVFSIAVFGALRATGAEGIRPPSPPGIAGFPSPPSPVEIARETRATVQAFRPTPARRGRR